MDLGFIVTFVIAVAALFIILKILALPMKIIIKLVINGIIGGIIIWLINLIGAGFGFVLTLNWITALVVGLLGVPGVIILVILHFIF